MKSRATKKKTKAKTKVKAKAKSSAVKVKAKTKLKAKAKTVVKAKAKTVVKAKPKKVVSAKAKPKAKIKVKVKVKTKTSVKAKAKVATKAKVVSKVKAVKKSKTAKVTMPLMKSSQTASIKVVHRSNNKFTDEQKEKILSLMELIINVRRGDREGLGSFEKIDRILDEYNQHYPTVQTKFDAITEYGMKKDPAFIPKNTFVPVKHKSDYEIKLYALLECMWEGIIRYQEAFDQMNAIYIHLLSEKTNHHFENENENENEYE